MPVYEYRCRRCGEVFDRLLPMGARAAPPCPSCEAAGAERLVSLIARSATCAGCGCGSGVT